MAKLIITLNTFGNIKEYEENKLISRYLVGQDMYANRVPYSFEFEEIKELIKKSTKEVYILVDKIFHEKELNSLETYLKKLKSLNINGIVFSDFAVYQLVKNMKWDINLTYTTDTTITNASFGLLAKEQGIKDIEIAKELTLKEIKSINNKKDVPIIMFIHGHIYMYNSFRKLKQNYLDQLNIKEKYEDEEFYLYDEERKRYYPLIENDNGTNILSAHDQQAFTMLCEILSTNIDYLKIDSLGYKKEDFEFIVRLYSDFINTYDKLKEQQDEHELKVSLKELSKKYVQDLKKRVPYKEFDNGFLKKKTIY